MKDPAILFYPSDFNDGTQDFTNEEVGAYLRLLLFQFSQGHLSLDRIKRKLGHDFEKLWEVLKCKFEKDSSGNFFNKRLEEESEKRKSYSESRRKNRMKKIDVNNTSARCVPHIENENENENINRSRDETSETTKTKKTLIERKEFFLNDIAQYLSEFSREMCREFFDYWSEGNKKEKMRFELEKAWDTHKRLQRWSRNQKQNGKQIINPFKHSPSVTE